MIPDIRQKLRDCLKLENISERDAAYIFVEIGKIIELTESAEKYPTLVFYRNWVVHSKIDRQSAYIKGLIERFKHLHISHEVITPHLLGFVSFDELKNNLITFFRQQIGQDAQPSFTFLDQLRVSLVKIISDVPVILNITDTDQVKLSFDHTEELHIEGPGTYKGSIKVIR